MSELLKGDSNGRHIQGGGSIGTRHASRGQTINFGARKEKNRLPFRFRAAGSRYRGLASKLTSSARRVLEQVP